MKTAEFKIHGMDCAEEVATLKKELGPLSGVQDLRFDIFNGKMTVTYAEDALRPDDLRAAVKRTGMMAEPWSEKKEALQPPTTWARRGRAVPPAVSGIRVAPGFPPHL